MEQEKTQELIRFQVVNKADSLKSLLAAIEVMGGEEGLLQGSQQLWDVDQQKAGLELFAKGLAVPNILTRTYGLRQQAMYLAYYGKLN